MGLFSGITNIVKKVASPVTSFLNANPWVSTLGGAALDWYGQKQAQDNANAINAANLNYTQQANLANLQLQDAFAKNSVQWRVQDAQKAGISPLAALGANVSSPSIGVMAHQDITSNKPSVSQALNSQLLFEAQIKKENAMANYYNSEAIAIAKSASDKALNRQQITTPWGKFDTSATTKQQQMEDEYGGIVGEVYGVSRFGNDVIIEPLKSRKGTFYRNPRRLPDIDLGPMP